MANTQEKGNACPMLAFDRLMADPLANRIREEDKAGGLESDPFTTVGSLETRMAIIQRS